MTEVSALPHGGEPVSRDDLAQILADADLSTSASLSALADRVTATEAAITAAGVARNSAAVSILQTTGDGTYTATVDLPAFATIARIHLEFSAAWTGTSAALTIDDGTTTFVNAHDLTADTDGDALEVVLDAQAGLYDSGARTLTFTVAQTGTGTAGITRGLVAWDNPASAQAAVKA